MSKKFEMFLKKIVCAFLSVTLSTSCLPAFVYAHESEQTIETSEPIESVEIVMKEYPLADGLKFYESVLQDKSANLQRTYRFEFTSGFDSEIVFATHDNMYNRSHISDLAENVNSLNGTVVAGMNADFFNMATGVPLSVVIKDGILITSDGGYNCLAKDQDGNLFIDTPSIKINILKGEETYSVWSLNKELVDWGLCMFTDDFDSVTHIKTPATIALMYPYTESFTDLEIAEILGISPTYDSPEDDSEDLQKNVGSEPLQEDLLQTEDGFNKETDEQETIKEDDASYQEDVTENENVQEQNTDEVLQYIFLPEDLAKMDEYASQNGLFKVENSYYKLTENKTVIGQSQNVVVAQILSDGIQEESLAIPENAYLLAGDNNTFAASVNKFAVGDTAVIDISANERFVGIQEAIGTSHIIVKDGKAVEENSLYHYMYANPRTAVGITEDGKLILFAVDGRQSGFSSGMKISELADEMIRLGCVVAANLDGGGSTTVKALLPNYPNFALVNSPSEKSERKISNAILFTNKLKSDSVPVFSYLGNTEIVMSNSFLPLSQPIYTDRNFYPVIVDPENDVQSEFTYTVDNGYIEEGIFYPDGYVGEVYVISNNGLYSNKAKRIISTDTVDEIYVESSQTDVYASQALNLNATAKKHSLDVVCTNESFEWSVDEEFGFVLEDGTFIALKEGENIEISATIGDVSRSVFVNIHPHPFIDIDAHWAFDAICKLYEQQIVEGEDSEYGPVFYPERTYSRNEFCVMLARVLNLTAIEKEPEDKPLETDETYNQLTANQGIEQPSEMIDENDQAHEDDDLLEEFDDVDFEVVDDKTDSKDIDVDVDLLEVSNVEQVVENQENAEDTPIQEEQTESQIIETENIEVLDDSVVESSPFADAESIPDWAYQSVIKLYENAYLDSFCEFSEDGKLILDGSFAVTRKQVISVIGRICNTAPEDYVLLANDITQDDPEYEYIKNACAAGIFEGYEDGSLKLSDNLKRSEGAAVFVRLFYYMNSLN